MNVATFPNGKMMLASLNKGVHSTFESHQSSRLELSEQFQMPCLSDNGKRRSRLSLTAYQAASTHRMWMIITSLERECKGKALQQLLQFDVRVFIFEPVFCESVLEEEDWLTETVFG